MEAIRQIYDKVPATIDIPPELLNRRVEIIMLPLDETSIDERKQSGLADVADPHSADFFGSIPDFPEREPQGEYETREEFE